MRILCIVFLAAIVTHYISGAVVATEIEDGHVKKWPLQERIDGLAANGGGTLVLTAGVYRTGALFFKPGVNLRLEKGAVIVGVDEADGYPMRETRIEGETCTYYPALVNADCCDGFTISGENVSTEMKMFPHWYCKAYAKYVDNEQSMKFDQHLLLVAIAPRRLLVEGFNEGWFDTKGEYLACRAASPTWKFLGKEGLPEGDFPANYDIGLVGSFFGYVRRGGMHGLSVYDWLWMLDFADNAFAVDGT